MESQAIPLRSCEMTRGTDRLSVGVHIQTSPMGGMSKSTTKANVEGHMVGANTTPGQA